MTSGWLVFMFISYVVGVVIWYFLNRASVRANRQIELLESINNKLSKIIDPSIEEPTNIDKSKEGYLEEARRKAGL